jgi:hypothetical protein
MIKSDVEGLEYQGPGVLVSTDKAAYEEYLRNRSIWSAKNNKIEQLETSINILNDKLNKLLMHLEGNK